MILSGMLGFSPSKRAEHPIKQRVASAASGTKWAEMEAKSCVDRNIMKDDVVLWGNTRTHGESN